MCKSPSECIHKQQRGVALNCRDRKSSSRILNEVLEAIHKFSVLATKLDFNGPRNVPYIYSLIDLIMPDLCSMLNAAL